MTYLTTILYQIRFSHDNGANIIQMKAIVTLCQQFENINLFEVLNVQLLENVTKILNCMHRELFKDFSGYRFHRFI